MVDDIWILLIAFTPRFFEFCLEGMFEGFLFKEILKEISLAIPRSLESWWKPNASQHFLDFFSLLIKQK